MMILLGAEFEEIYERTKELPNPESPETDDEKALFKFLVEYIPSDPTRFRKW